MGGLRVTENNFRLARNCQHDRLEFAKYKVYICLQQKMTEIYKNQPQILQRQTDTATSL
jgi:hypothetical protein